MKPHDAPTIPASLDPWPGQDWLGPAGTTADGARLASNGLPGNPTLRDHPRIDHARASAAAHSPAGVAASTGTGAGTSETATATADAAANTTLSATLGALDRVRPLLDMIDATSTCPALPRRIAMISDHASPLAAPGSIDCGGQNVYVAHLARELARAGIAVDIFTRRDAPGQPAVVPWLDGVRVIHVPAGPACHVPKEQMLPYVDTFARFVARFARRQPAMYDLVHANFFMSGMVASQLKRTLGLPFVITFHALGQVRRLAQGVADGFPAQRTAIETGLMREAGRVIAECPQDRLDMERLYDAPSARIAVVPCGFSPDEFWPVPTLDARRRLHVAPARFVVLQLGRIVPRKGVDTVIQSVAMLRQRHAIDAELLIVGGDHRLPEQPAMQALDGAGSGKAHRRISGAANGQMTATATRSTAGSVRSRSSYGALGHDGAELARLRQLARELGIGPHVRFEGLRPREALRDYYAAANVFASTPWYEPFGITPVEAMACARAVVGAEVGGIKSTVLDGVTGYLVPSRDPEALADRLARLQREPERAQRMGQLGRVRACEHYTWQRVAQQVMAVYNDVLQETRAAHRPALLSSQESA